MKRFRTPLMMGLIGLAALLLAGPAIALASTSHQITPQGDHSGGVPEFDHVYIIMMENHSTPDIIGDPNAPFINSLATTYGFAANYFGVTHPSFPNYLAATSGSNWDINFDPTTVQNLDHTNIVDQLEANHRTWKAYMDGMIAGQPQTDGANGNRYVVKHDPFIMYTDVQDNPTRLQNIVPLTQLSSDLNHPDKLPNYIWISPDQCNDMHGIGGANSPCPYANTQGDQNDQNLIADGDAFVRTWVTAIMHSRAWTSRSVIFLTWDENDFAPTPNTEDYINDDGCCDSPTLPAGSQLSTGGTWPGGVLGGGEIPMIIIGAKVKHGFVSNLPYNHYSMLKTIEDSWNLGHIGAASDDQQVKNMSEFFNN
jgi:hypothetical protein